MRGLAETLLRYMDGSSKRFVIPVYQRNYDWKKENCEQLFDDLVRVSREHRRNHFFGSIVSVTDDGRDFLIIDGQQRLTTVSLLFLAMYHLLDEGKIIPADFNLKNRLYEVYLVDKYASAEKRLKLKPVKNDKTAFEKLFEENSEHIGSSNLTQNYNYFYKRILQNEITIDELYCAIEKLEIINITLDRDDDPQLIFESLNSTGLDLTEGDKIRNFVLMGRDAGTQEIFYERYWNKIEELTNYDVTEFIRHYLMMRKKSFVKRDMIYPEFKNFTNFSATEEDLKDLLRYAKFYSILLNGNFGDKTIDSCIFRLNYIETSPTRPFLLSALALHEEGILSLNELREIFVIIESFVFRRAVCGLPTSALNKVFAALHAEIVRYENNTENYFEKFKFSLLEKDNTNAFPRNNEFLNNLFTRDIYKETRNKQKIYILERFENFGTREDKDVYRHCDNGDYSIEHIMPQTLTMAWKTALGENWETIQNDWLHTLPNLTLTAYNSRYSNKSFEEKKTMEKGFRESGIRMNQFIAQKEKWTLEELQERKRIMEDQALKIWPFPQTNFVPVKKEKWASLADEIEWTGKKILKCEFAEIVVPANNWIDVFLEVVKILFEKNPAILYRIAAGGVRGLSQYFSERKSNLRSPILFDKNENIFIETNTNSSMKKAILRNLFDVYHEDFENLKFVLRD